MRGNRRCTDSLSTYQRVAANSGPRPLVARVQANSDGDRVSSGLPEAAAGMLRGFRPTVHSGGTNRLGANGPMRRTLRFSRYL
jgi:hypothetical protein